MEAARTVWAIRLAGLVLFLLSYVVLSRSGDFYGWMLDRVGEPKWLGGNLGDVIDLTLFVGTVVSFRLFVFGWPTWTRVGLVLVVFGVLYAVVENLPRPAGDTNPYYDEGVEIAVWIYLFVPAVASLILAAVSLFDGRFRPRPMADAS